MTSLRIKACRTSRVQGYKTCCCAGLGQLKLWDIIKMVSQGLLAAPGFTGDSLSLLAFSQCCQPVSTWPPTPSSRLLAAGEHRTCTDQWVAANCGQKLGVAMTSTSSFVIHLWYKNEFLMDPLSSKKRKEKKKKEEEKEKNVFFNVL